MVESRYAWESGVELEEHTRRKHKILREYIARYLAVRCALPQQSKFRLAIVEGFAGGGRYKGGEPGSPLVFIEELRAAAEGFNLKRKNEGMAALDIECLLVLNDAEPGTTAILKNNVDPIVAAIRDDVPKLHLQTVYFEKPFEALYPEIRALLEQGRYHNVIFNLDQYGHSDVKLATLSDIADSFTSAEIFYTFGILSLLAFLAKNDPALLRRQLGFLGVIDVDLSPLESQLSRNEWLGAAERIVFETLGSCAQYVSTFSIHNPEGWRYWLIHLANNYRARQEYNNILHQNSSMQAHFGRSGLNMLSYDPRDAGALYLFDVSGRASAKSQLLNDVPQLVTEFGDAVDVEQFYSTIYKLTPAHTDEIHAAIIENPDLEVTTESGGVRRRVNTIRAGDTLRMKQQRTFFPMFLGTNKKA